MGSATFVNYGEGSDARAVFNTLVDQAGYEHGHSYSGSIAEKSQFRVLSHTPLLLSAAEERVNVLINTPEVSDKWGPAGALPVVTKTRTVRVHGFTYDPRTQDLTEVVTQLLRTSARIDGVEKVQSVSMLSHRGERRDHAGPRTDCVAEVVVEKAPLTRTVRVTVKVPGTVSSHDAYREAATVARSKVTLRGGEQIASAKTVDLRPGAPKVAAVASKGATETRYLIKGSTQHSRWETGLPSQAAARAAAVELASRPHGTFEPVMAEYEITAVTRRIGGEPLVRVTRSVASYDADVDVEVLLRGAITPRTEPDGWLFFGWASS